MANTVIQLKYSTVTATPTALNVAEPAYSYTSNTLFIGSPTGTGAIAIGGKFYLDQQQDIYNSANAAFAAANAAGTSTTVNSAFQAANSAGSYANSAFITANTADNKATSAGIYANGAFAAANSAGSYANSAFATANNEAGVNATQNNSIAAAFIAANSSGSYGNTSFITANAAFVAANSAGVYANGAFTRANNAINANTGGTITGDLSITGNLSVLGNTFTVSSTTIVANDTVIILGANNYTSDLLDIGFGAHYNDGANAHTGLIRDSGTKEWQLFEGYVPEIGANNNININDPSFKIATLNANVHSTKILIKGIDLLPYVNIAFNTANAAFATANSAGSYANSAFIRANNSLDRTTGGSITGSIGVTSNVYAGNIIANSAFTSLNGTSKLSLSDIGIVAIDVAGEQFKFQASGIESSKGIFGGAFGGNKLSLNNETILVSDRFDLVKIQTGEDGTVKNEFSFANNAFIAPGEITAGSVVAGGINVVPTLAVSFNTANAAFAQANTDVTGISITAAHYGTASFVPAFRVEANGRISSANSTAIAIDTSAITSGTLGVARGGTGAGTFTTNGVLLGQGTSALTTASSSTEGHVLTINASGVPTFAHLQGGTF